MSGWVDWGKNLLNKGVQELGKKWSPPPEKDMFQLTGELSPDEFKRAGSHLIKICNGWQWKPAEKKELNSQYLKENEQYLLLEKAICRRRLNSSLEAEEKKTEDKVIQEGDDEIVVLEGPGVAEEEEKEENYRYYKMYIIYDEYYHTPRMFFSATQNGVPVSNTDIRLDIQREYLDKTLTMEEFPFLQGVVMPTVHPCRHAAVLKTMSDSMSEGGHQIESHFALLIFLKFISSVIPYVEFDTVGDLIFN